MSNATRMAKARKARSRIAKTFAALDNDQLHILDVLTDIPPCLKRILVYDVLRRVPRLNRDGAEKVLAHSRVWPLKRMGNLTELERQRIIAALPPRVKNRH